MSHKSTTTEGSAQSEIPNQEQIDAHALASVQDYLDSYTYISQHTTPSPTLFDLHLMSNVRLVSASINPPSSISRVTVLWDLDITPYYANLNGVMHGGAAGVIFDMTTTAALCPIQRDKYWDFMGGVTRILNINYLKAVPVGLTVRIRCELVQVGRTMAMIEGLMESMPAGANAQEVPDVKTVYVTCTHSKVNVPSLPHHLKLREEMRSRKKKGEWKRPDEMAKL